LKKLTDGVDEKKPSSLHLSQDRGGVRTKGRSTKAKIHFEKQKPLQHLNHFLILEMRRLFLMKLMMKMILKWKTLKIIIRSKIIFLIFFIFRIFFSL
jgi:hypothetical protein